MTIRIVCAVFLILGVALMGNADWITYPIGRISVQRHIDLSTAKNLQDVLGIAGAAYNDAYEAVSRIVEEHCTENPAECVALGVSVRPQQSAVPAQ